MFFAFLAALSGQHIQTKQYTISDGLVQSQVNTITQDGYGRMWFGTVEGLSCYDGSVFKNYTVDNIKVKSYNIISSFYDPAENTLWFGTFSGGLFAVRGDTVSARIESEPKGRKWFRVNSFIKYGGEILAATNSGLGKIFSPPDSFSLIELTIPDNRINDLALTRDGKLILGTLSGIGVLDSSFKLVRWIGKKEGLTNSFINSLVCIGENTILSGGRKGLSRITLSPALKIENGIGIKLFKHPFVNSIYVSESGSVWLGTGQGIYKYEEGEPVYYKIKDYFYKSIFQDREGNIWFGSRGGGVLKLTDELFVNYNLDDGLPNQEILSIFSASDNKVWCGTNYGFFSMSDAGIKSYHVKVSNYANIVTDFAEFGNYLYFTTWDGIYRLRNNEISQVKFLFKKENLFRRWKFIEVFDNKLIVANRISVYYSPDSKKLIKLPLPAKEKISDIKTLAEGNILAVATVNHYYLFSKGMSLLSHGEIEKKTIQSIIPLSGSSFYLGTDKGLLLLIHGSRITDFPENSALEKYHIMGGAFDKFGQLWLGTNTGLLRLRNGKVYRYSTQQGFIGDEIITNRSIAPDKYGHIYIGTFIGLSKCYPEKETHSLIPPQILIKRIELPHEEVSADNSGITIAPEENTIRFSFVGISFHDESDVRYQTMLEGLEKNWSRPFRNPGIKYTNLPAGGYVFKVKAINGAGIVSEKPAVFSFTVLAPIYLRPWFIVLATLAALTLFYILHLYKIRRIELENKRLDLTVREKTKQLIKEKEKLEKANKELDKKTKELSELLVELKETQGQLVQTNKVAALGRLINGIIKEINDPLTYIFTNSYHLENYIKEISAFVKRVEREVIDPEIQNLLKENETLYAIEDMEKIILGYKSTIGKIINILDSLNIYGSNPHEEESLDISVELDRAFGQVKRKFPGIRISSPAMKPGIFIRGNSLQFQQAIISLLENSAEFTKGKGKITVKVKREDDILLLHITDNGPGIPEEIRDKIFEPFFTTRENEKKLGLGLAITMGIINHFEGKITLADNGKKGAHFILRFPIIN
jgi:signal transduction histidine kinase